MKWWAEVTVDLKPGTLDPAGEAILDALVRLGHESVDDVRVGKRILLTIEAPDQQAADERVEAMCRTLLANPVLERYAFRTMPGADARAASAASGGA